MTTTAQATAQLMAARETVAVRAEPIHPAVRIGHVRPRVADVDQQSLLIVMSVQASADKLCSRLHG